MDDDFGKVRVYECLCGGTPVRPLRGSPKPCDHCDRPLEGRPFKIEDHPRFVERLIADARGTRAEEESDGP
uniref:Uncharacterized protein n=1 Tax=viral metagenome TaxID=1070528 RepID=A0A6H1ZXM7_9ZZZZ